MGRRCSWHRRRGAGAECPGEIGLSWCREDGSVKGAGRRVGSGVPCLRPGSQALVPKLESDCVGVRTPSQSTYNTKDYNKPISKTSTKQRQALYVPEEMGVYVQTGSTRAVGLTDYVLDGQGMCVGDQQLDGHLAVKL